MNRWNLQICHVKCNSRKGAGRVARAIENAMVPVCDGRACACAWLGDGSTDGC